MNVTLHQEERSCWETALSTVLNREETLEMIVPDACPDIQEIIDTDGCLCLRSKACGDGCITLSGAIPCTVLYQPEGGGGLYPLKAEVPFQFTAELEGADAACHCLIRPQLLSSETRAINPRKVLLRVGFQFEVTVCRPSRLCCTGDIPDGEKLGIQQRRTQQSGSFLTHVGQRSFPCSDVLPLPGSRPAIGELLRTRCRAFLSETRLTGGRLILKGGVAIRLLYLDREEELCTAELELPFSQIMDVGTAEDNAGYEVTVTILDCLIEPEEDSGREISAELELLAQAVIREEQSLELVADAYSIHHPGVPEYAPCVLPQLVEQTVRRQNLREAVDAAFSPREVWDARAYPGQVRLMNGELMAEVRLSALCLTEDGRYGIVSRQVQVKCPIETAEQAHFSGWCDVAELDASTTGDSVEFRLGVDFHWTLLREERVNCLSGFQFDTESVCDRAHQPSVILRQVGAGETLWDIAKAHLTTIEEIRQANALDTERTEEGQLLLIPKKR